MLPRYRFGSFAYVICRWGKADVIGGLLYISWSVIWFPWSCCKRSSNDIPLPVGFRHRGRLWHINPMASREDQWDWSNRNIDHIHNAWDAWGDRSDLPPVTSNLPKRTVFGKTAAQVADDLGSRKILRRSCRTFNFRFENSSPIAKECKF